MEESNKTKGVEKPSEETLKYWLDKAVSDNKQLIAKLQQVTDALNILPYLLKIVEMEDKFNATLVAKSKEAIESILFAPVEAEKEKED